MDYELYESLYKVATIRNPWDRLISLYFSPNRKKEVFDKKEFKALIQKEPSVFHYTNELNLFDKLTSKIGTCQSNNSKNVVDFFLRFEKLQEDFEKLCEKLNLEKEKLPVVNSSKRKHYSKYYDNQLKDLVYRKYKHEIETFQYKFEDY